MQNYKNPQPPHGAAPPPMSMTMSLNGPPGYQMQQAALPSTMHGYLSCQTSATAPGVREGQRTVTAASESTQHREAYYHGMQTSPGRKQTVVAAGTVAVAPAGIGGGNKSNSSSSSSNGGGNCGQIYATRQDPHQMSTASHHHQHHQQPQPTLSLSRSQHRSPSMSTHQIPQPHPQQHQSHVSQHARQQQLAGYHNDKGSTGTAQQSSSLFKTPASGYSPTAVSHNMANGMHSGVHPSHHYTGYSITAESSSSSSNTSAVMVDPSNHRMVASGSNSVSASAYQRPEAAVPVYRTSSSASVVSVSESGSRHPQQQLNSVLSQQQMLLQQQQQQQVQNHPGLQKVSHAYSQQAHVAGHVQPGTVALPIPSPLSPHLQLTNSHSASQAHTAGVPSHNQTSALHMSAQSYLHPPGHSSVPAGLSGHHQPSQPHHPGLRPASPSAGELHHWSSASSSSSATVMPHQLSVEAASKHGNSERHAVGIPSQPQIGSIRTGEPRVQGVGPSARGNHLTGTNLMMPANCAGLAPPSLMPKGSIQLGTPAMKPVMVSTEGRMDSTEASKGCKVSPNQTSLPLDLSKIRPEHSKQGDSPLDLSVKTRKRSVDDSLSGLDHSKLNIPPSTSKKVRYDQSQPRSHELYFHYPSDVPGSDGQVPVGSIHSKIAAGMKGNVTSAAQLQHHASFKSQPASPAAYSMGSSGLQNPLGITSQKTHLSAYPSADPSHTRSSSRNSSSSGSTPQSRPHSIEMSFEGKVEDLMPKLVKGIAASPAMISPLHTQLEQINNRTEMSVQAHAMHVKQLQQHQQREIAATYVASTEKQRHAMGEPQSLCSLPYAQQHIARQQQVVYPPKHSQSASSISRRAIPPSATHLATSVPLHAAQEYVSGHPLLTAQAQHHYSQQKYQQLQLQQHSQHLQEQQQQVQMMQERQLKHQQQMLQQSPRPGSQQTSQIQHQQQYIRETNYSQRATSSDMKYSYSIREEDIRKAKPESSPGSVQHLIDERHSWNSAPSSQSRSNKNDGGENIAKVANVSKVISQNVDQRKSLQLEPGEIRRYIDVDYCPRSYPNECCPGHDRQASVQIIESRESHSLDSMQASGTCPEGKANENKLDISAHVPDKGRGINTRNIISANPASGRQNTDSSRAKSVDETFRPPSASSRKLSTSLSGKAHQPNAQSVSQSKVEEGTSFQRPQAPVIVGGSRQTEKPNDINIIDLCSSDDVPKSNEKQGVSTVLKVSTPIPSDDFTAPLSVTIPASPSAENGSRARPSSPALPKISSINCKMMPRKRMILNAVNQDESLKKIIGVSGVKSELVPSGAKVDQRLRQFTSSPPPSSPKMPILSPQEKGGDSDVASGQNDDPPTLEPPPTKIRSAKGSNNLVPENVPTTSGPATVTPPTSRPNPPHVNQSHPPSLPPSSLSLPPQTPDSASKPTSPEGIQNASPMSEMAALGAVGDVSPSQDKAGTVVVRRCSLTSDVDRTGDIISQCNQQPVPFNIRRNSLDRPWGHQKNIPVANVAPFMHSKSAAEFIGRESPETLQSLVELEPSLQEPVQSKSDETKLPSTEERKLPSLVDVGRKSPSHSLYNPSNHERKKLRHNNPKSVKKSTNFMKRISKLGRTKLKMKDIKNIISAPSDQNTLNSTLDCELDSNSETEQKQSPAQSRKFLKHKRIVKKGVAERPKSGAQNSEPDGDETEEFESTETSESTPEKKSKKDLAKSREERAKRRALLRGTEDDRKTVNRKTPSGRTARRRLSSTNQKARELKRTALGRRTLRDRGSKRKAGHYNRNAAYEKEVKREEKRRSIRRATRHASHLARQRLQQQHLNQNDADDVADDNSRDEIQSLPRDDEPWDISASHTPQSSRKSRSARGIPRSRERSSEQGSSGKAKTNYQQDQSDLEEDYFDDADDELKDASDDDDGDETETAEGSPIQRNKTRSLASRRKKRGKSRLARKQTGELTDSQCREDSLDCPSREDTLLEGEDTVELPVQSAIPVPPEVKRIAVNKNSGETLLHRAARLGNEEVTLYCLRSGEYNVNARDNAGYTALHESCVKGSVRVARHLILHGADVNCCSQDGIRPLHDAVENNHVEVARLLLSQGADPLIATYGGKTPLKIARSLVMYDVIQGYLGDLNGYGSEDEREWTMPGSYGLNVAGPDNGFDIFANVPSDGDNDNDTNENLNEMFDDGILATIPTYLIPSTDAKSNQQVVVLQEDLLKHLRISFKHFSSITSCMRAQIHVTREQILRMLDHSTLRREGHQQHALLESEKLTVLPLAALRKVEVTLEQLSRRSAVKGSCAVLSEFNSDNDSSLIKHLGEMSLSHHGDDDEEEDEEEDNDNDDASERDDLCEDHLKEKVNLTSSVTVALNTKETTQAKTRTNGEKALELVFSPGSLWIKNEKPLSVSHPGSSTGSQKLSLDNSAFKHFPGKQDSFHHNLGSYSKKPTIASSANDSRSFSGPSTLSFSRSFGDKTYFGEKSFGVLRLPGDKTPPRFGESLPVLTLPSPCTLSSKSSSSFSLKASVFQPLTFKTEKCDTACGHSKAAGEMVQNKKGSTCLLPVAAKLELGSSIKSEEVSKKAAEAGVGTSLGERSSKRSSAQGSELMTLGDVVSGSGVIIKSSGHVTKPSSVVIRSSQSAPSVIVSIPGGDSSKKALTCRSSGMTFNDVFLSSLASSGQDWNKDGKLHSSASGSAKWASKDAKSTKVHKLGQRHGSTLPLASQRTPSPAALSSKDSLKYSKSVKCASTNPSSVSSHKKDSNRESRYAQWANGKSTKSKSSQINNSSASSSSSLSSEASSRSSYSCSPGMKSPYKTDSKSQQHCTLQDKQYLYKATSKSAPLSSSSLSMSNSSNKELIKGYTSSTAVDSNLGKSSSSSSSALTSYKSSPAILSTTSLPANKALTDNNNDVKLHNLKPQATNHKDVDSSPFPSEQRVDPGAKTQVHWDVGPMFSDESSSSSFIMENLDYDSSCSPIANSAIYTRIDSATSSSTKEMMSESLKEFSFGSIGVTMAGKDRNDNEIGCFYKK